MMVSYSIIITKWLLNHKSVGFYTVYSLYFIDIDIELCILLFYVFNSNLIYFYLNLIKSYKIIFNVKHQEHRRWCGAT